MNIIDRLNINNLRQDEIDRFKAWCTQNKKAPNRGVSVSQYIKQKEGKA